MGSYIDERYYKDVGKIKPLKDKETRALLKKYRDDGDRKSLDEAIQGNLRLVIKIAQAISDNHREFDDIIAHGNIGLIKAAERYDVDRNVQFNTYASWWIRQSIWSFIKDSENKPVNKRLHRKAVRKHFELTESLNREPTVCEMASGIGCSERLAAELVIDCSMQMVPIYEIEDRKIYEHGCSVSPEHIFNKLSDIDKIVVAAKLQHINTSDFTDILMLRHVDLSCLLTNAIKKSNKIKAYIIETQ